MNDGFITVHRKIVDWEWYTDTNTTRLFLHLLIKANHRDKKHRGTLVKRGELLTSYELLNLQTGLSRQNLRTSLKKLASTDDITIDSTNKGTRLTVCNYDSYQTKKEQPNHQPNLPLTNEQPTTNQQLTTNNNDNNLNNENKEEEETRERQLPPFDPFSTIENLPSEFVKIFSDHCKQPFLTHKFTEAEKQEFLAYWLLCNDHGYPTYTLVRGWNPSRTVANRRRQLIEESNGGEETEVEKYMRELREEDEDNDE